MKAFLERRQSWTVIGWVFIGFTDLTHNVLVTLLLLLLGRKGVHGATFLAWWFCDILPWWDEDQLDKLTAWNKVQPKKGLPGQKDGADFSFLGVGGGDIDRERMLAGIGIGWLSERKKKAGGDG